MHMWNSIFIVTLVLISIRVSRASPRLDFFRNLAEQNETLSSPEPASAPGDNFSAGGQNVRDTCKSISPSCQQKALTACLPYPENGPQGSNLLVVNDGESSMIVKITVLPANISEEIPLPSHHTKISNLTNVGLGSSIILNAEDGNCIIHIEAPAPQNDHYPRSPSYRTYVTPIHGAYLLFIIIVILGGTWACCMLRVRGRHLDGVPYQELEMGNSNDLPSIDVETGEGWDRDWDDDWDEEKTVKSPSENDQKSKPINGFGPKTVESNGWGVNWDD